MPRPCPRDACVALPYPYLNILADRWPIGDVGARFDLQSAFTSACGERKLTARDDRRDLGANAQPIDLKAFADLSQDGRRLEGERLSVPRAGERLDICGCASAFDGCQPT